MVNAFALMLGVTVCYTITSFSDKYAVSKAKFSGDEFTFLTDVIYGAELAAMKLLCIAATVTGLALIVKSGRENKIEYRKIAVPLVLYLTAKYSYGLIIKTFTPYVSPTMQFMPALVLVSLVMLTKIRPHEIFKKNKNGAVNVILARVPNTIGMLMENMPLFRSQKLINGGKENVR